MDNKYKIINYLGKHPDNVYTMHELSKILNIPYASFYRTIESMKDLLNIIKIGKSKVIKLNGKNSIVKTHLILSSDEERKDYLKKQPIINKIYQELNTKDVVVLFGSYAKKNQTEKSDIDLIIINKEGNKSISFSKYEVLFKIKINPIFITKGEFKLMIKDSEENVGKQALYNNIILNNPEKFWGLVFNGV
ncbi:nucleotidyltransferase domain-containing protein [Candidatus Woesearchaeota archaeon]|nr:nucleotidyltransferase domain-containing protein [Candidatus Woesearchaeota archaeon]MBL7051383.1 nucleotidyltransferase domain-containing protein [Candidatus Woesearchaeota archaeon]